MLWMGVCAYHISRLVGQSVGRLVGWLVCVWNTTCLNAALLVARLSVLILLLAYEKGQSVDALPSCLYTPFFCVCERAWHWH